VSTRGPIVSWIGYKRKREIDRTRDGSIFTSTIERAR
jgi:hypothetical protein